jgi:hypothetical protein
MGLQSVYLADGKGVAFAAVGEGAVLGVAFFLDGGHRVALEATPVQRKRSLCRKIT